MRMRVNASYAPNSLLLLHYPKSSSLDFLKPSPRFYKPSLKILPIISLLESEFFEDNWSPSFIFTSPTVYYIGLGKW